VAAVALDLLPACSELIAQGYVEWSADARMNLVGFEHVFTRAIPIVLRAVLKIGVAPLESECSMLSDRARYHRPWGISCWNRLTPPCACGAG